MVPFYREITYRAWTPRFHQTVQERADELPGVDILLAKRRPLSWLERERLFRDEFGCRVVLAIVSRDEDVEVVLTRGADPYRSSFEEFIRRVRPDVRNLILDIDAEHREVKSGRLRFETKAIARSRADALQGRLLPFAREMRVELEFCDGNVGEDYSLHGRAFGSILGIHRLSYALLSSPFVTQQHLDVAFD